MTESGAGTEHEEPLQGFEAGDVVNVSARETSMEVTDVRERPNGNRVLEATNHHGRYRLKGYPDGDIALWASAQFQEMVEVSKVE